MEKDVFLMYLEDIIDRTDDGMDMPVKERVLSVTTPKILASITGWVVVIAFG